MTRRQPPTEYDADEYEDYRPGRKRRRPGRHSFRNGLITGMILAAALVLAFGVAIPNRLKNRDASNEAESVTVSASSDHDVTLAEKKYADFATPLLGEAKRKALLTVEERSVSVIVNNTQEGAFNWEILQKSEAVRYYGTAEYTVDLSGFSEDDIVVDHDTKTVTITIPETELHSVVLDPDKTEVLSSDNGLIFWEDLKLTTEEQQKLEASAIDAMKEELDREDALTDAERFAHLTAWETFWPVVSSVSEENGEAYKLVISQEHSGAVSSDAGGIEQAG